MEYYKDNGKFSFGAGNERVAGKGNLSCNRQATLNKFTFKKAITMGLQTIAVAMAVGIKLKFSKK